MYDMTINVHSLAMLSNMVYIEIEIFYNTYWINFKEAPLPNIDDDFVMNYTCATISTLVSSFTLNERKNESNHSTSFQGIASIHVA